MLGKYSVKKPYTVVVGVILVIVLGVISFTNMTTDLLPNMDFPYVIVYDLCRRDAGTGGGRGHASDGGRVRHADGHQ